MFPLGDLAARSLCPWEGRDRGAPRVRRGLAQLGESCRRRELESDLGFLVFGPCRLLRSGPYGNLWHRWYGGSWSAWETVG
jgi:hypothetical protein